MNCLELCCVGRGFVSFPAAGDEKIAEARGFAVRVPEEMPFAVFIEHSVLLASAFSSHQKCAKRLVFGHDVIAAAHRPAPAFVRSKKYIGQNPKRSPPTGKWSRSILCVVSCSHLFIRTFTETMLWKGRSCQQLLNTADKSCLKICSRTIQLD